MSRRVQRLNKLFQEHLAEMIREIRDPRMPESIISITKVDTSPDLETADVYISVLGEAEEKRGAIEALTHASSFLKRELLHRVSMRHVPYLHFVLDETIEEAARIMDLINKVSPDRKLPK